MADALVQSNSVVFIDPTTGKADDTVTFLSECHGGSPISLAVNGAIEQTSLGTFTSPLMREAIAGQ